MLNQNVELEVEKMNKKSGETFMSNVGKQYLDFLLTSQWLRKSDKKVIAKILITEQKLFENVHHTMNPEYRVIIKEYILYPYISI